MDGNRTGIVYLVGAGPGDPGLLTVRGRRLLDRARVVVHDRLVDEAILDLIPREARRIDVGKTTGHHPVPQEEINRILVREASEGQDVVRLKGGDCFLFGRGGEELEFLAEHGIGFEVVPGITSALGATAYAGIPVTHRDHASSVHLVTGHRRQDGKLDLPYAQLAGVGGTLVLMMAVANIGEIAGGLMNEGMDPQIPVAVIEQGTRSGQRTISASLAGVGDEVIRCHVRPPALFVVGQVAALAGRLAWYDRKPLKGRTVLVTRPREEADLLTKLLREQGARVVARPLIETVPFPSALPETADRSILVFTSAAGVRSALDAWFAAGRDARALTSVRLAVIGPGTARALQEYGLRADFMPAVYNARALGEQMVESGFASGEDRLLLLRAARGTDDLPETLEQLEISFRDQAVYETRIIPAAGLDPSVFDAVTFTSASCVTAFCQSVPPRTDLSGVLCVCIGERTAQAAQDAGMQAVASREATMESMAETLLRVLGQHPLKEETSC